MRKLRLAAAVCLYLPAFSGVAETQGASPSFSAKRIGVPAPGARKLNVQIDPEAQRAALAALPRSGPVPPLEEPEPGVLPGPAADPFGWFWNQVSPALAAAGPGRLPGAMEAVLGRSDLPQPRLADLQRIARANGSEILRATIGTKVSPALVLAVISVESAGRAQAVSHAGAQGLMQLMPATARRFGVADSLKPQENIAGGVKYLDWLMAEFDGDPILVLAGYNAGEGAVRDHAGVPPYAETRGYVPKVLAAYQVARGLCRTPPELLSDGCVFVGTN